jgi:pyroglutamyl-peptidase
MTHVLLTAFQPYQGWQTNASWLTLVELTRELPQQPQITTRLYPVDYETVLDRIQGDVSDHYDYVLLTGQAPGRARIEIETVALNLAADIPGEGDACRPLIADGPLAYSSSLPADSLCARIRQAGIPAAVSRHGGTYLCNAALYYALHQINSQQLTCQAAFIHVPLDTSQAAVHTTAIASLPAAFSAQALRIILQSLCDKPAETDLA